MSYVSVRIFQRLNERLLPSLMLIVLLEKKKLMGTLIGFILLYFYDGKWNKGKNTHTHWSTDTHTLIYTRA